MPPGTKPLSSPVSFASRVNAPKSSTATLPSRTRTVTGEPRLSDDDLDGHGPVLWNFLRTRLVTRRLPRLTLTFTRRKTKTDLSLPLRLTCTTQRRPQSALTATL